MQVVVIGLGEVGRQRALQLLANKYEQYERERPDRSVLAIDVAEWCGLDASGSPRGAR